MCYKARVDEREYPLELGGRWRDGVVLKRDVFSTIERGRFSTDGGEVSRAQFETFPSASATSKRTYTCGFSQSTSVIVPFKTIAFEGSNSAVIE